MASKPFAFLGISADTRSADVKEFVNAHQLSWPNIVDGRHGPRCAAWKVEYFPSVFVIDRMGVIRHKDLRGRDLQRAVAKLVEEAERAASPS